MWPQRRDIDASASTYKAVPLEFIEDDMGEREERARKSIHESIPRCIPQIIGVLFKLMLFGFAMWGVANIGHRTFSITIARDGPASCSCGGTTTAEAVRRGCIFTPLAIAWLPPHCLDMELSAEFDEAGPNGKWEYWKDPNGSIPMSREEMAMLPDTKGVFYTSQEWHITHCMFTWRKHYRSQFTGTVVEGRSNGIRHIAHCESIMKVRGPLENVWTRAGIELNADLV